MKARCEKADDCGLKDCPHFKAHGPIPNCTQIGGNCTDSAEECEIVGCKVKCLEVPDER